MGISRTIDNCVAGPRRKRRDHVNGKTVFFVSILFKKKLEETVRKSKNISKRWKPIMWHSERKPVDEINVSRTKLMPHSTCPIAFLLVGALLGVSGCLMEFELQEEPVDRTETSSDQNSQNGTSLEHDSESDVVEDGETTEDSNEVDTAEYFDTLLDDTATPDPADDIMDTATLTTQDSEGDQDIETELAPCPTGVELGPAVVYLDLIDGSSAKNYKYEDFCGKGEIIVGYRGFFRDRQDDVVHGKIQALCAKPTIWDRDGKCEIEFGTPSRLPLRGDTGHIRWTRKCSQGEVIVGYQGRTGSDIDRIVFSCARLILQAGKNGYTISRGESSALPVAGGNGGNYDHQDECPESQVPTSSILTASSLNINALGLGCRELFLVQ